MKPNPSQQRRRIALAVAAALAGSSVGAQAQVALNPSSRVTPVTSKPGFVYRVFQNQANQDNSTIKTENALAGLLVDGEGNPLPNLADPNAQGPALNPGTGPATPNGLVEFEIATVINLNQAEGGTQGSFTPDEQMPGIPGTDGSTDGIAVEVITYLELQPGTYTMGVASDDGFRVSAGNLKDAFQGTILGEYSGGRGTTESLFSFTVSQAGVYPFRLTYEEGGGGADLEWYSLVASGGTTNRVLINDTANGGIKAYRSANTVAQPPYIKSVSPGPAPRQLNGVARTVSLVLSDGDTVAINDASIDFQIDGRPVTTKSRNGKEVTLTYTPDGIQFPNESHTATLTFTGAGGFTRSESWSFRNLKNVVLPTPVATENFDSYAEGTLPTGWTALNFTVDCDDPAETVSDDITSQRSDIYKDWAIITPETAEANIDDYGMTNVNATETVNGQPLTIEMLRSGKYMYAESDSRCNGTNPARPVAADAQANYGQVQFITSKAFNLSTVANPVLSFMSGYVQNQDSYGGVEYSVDGGANWLPVVYFLDDADIVVKADGTTDGVETLTRTQTDTAVWVQNGVQKGNSYGDALSAPINAAISDYIVPRINDNNSEGKRIEIFRLPAAANKSDVRLRFSATGSDSWYWFVDNIAFYNVAPAVVTAGTLNKPTLANGVVTISWTGAGTLEEATSPAGPWTAVSSQANPQTVTPSGTGAKLFRLRN